MDPHAVFDCQKIVSNRFALAMAAAARARALTHGAQPRRDLPYANPSDLALHEIAAGAFSPDEMTPFLSGAAASLLLAPVSTTTELCGCGHRVLPPQAPPVCRRRFPENATT